jgi:hypothetical protein
VAGIDESGNVTGPGTFALAAVRCPRDRGERLAELLIENKLNPWRTKSETLTEVASAADRKRRVESLVEDLATESIPWAVACGYSATSIHHKAAAVCMLTKKTITQDPEFSGDVVIIPDGSNSMYGDSQQHLRTQSSQIFDGSFQSAFGGVYITGMPKADLTYPEAIAADYIAGYMRGAIDEGQQPNDLPDEVVWFDNNWREPTVSPSPYYRIKGNSGDYGGLEKNRAAAWVKGRHRDGDDYDVRSQWDNTIDMIESDTVQEYLTENFSA